MNHFRLLCFSLLWASLGSVLLCEQGLAEAPIKIADIVAVDDLVAEANAKAVQLSKHLVSRKAYVDTKKDDLAQAAGTLACVAQAISEHPGAKDAKVAGPALRDAALILRRPKSFEDAKVAEKALNAALKGQGDGKMEFSWAKLIAREAMMEEINSRNSKLRRVIRRSRKPNVDSLHASTMAVLSVAMYADAHGHDQDKASLAEWREISKESVGIMASIAGAIKKKDAAGAKRLYVRALKTCTDCHEKFRD